MRSPPDLAYGLEARPPAPVVVATALQQTTVILIWIFPVVLISRELRATPEEAAALIGMSFLASGIGTMIQAVRRWNLGCGFLAPLTSSSPHLLPSLMAAKAGGLPLLAGMTLAAGLTTVLLAQVLHRLRSLIPPEVAGAVVLIIGLAISVAGIRTLFETPDGSPPGGETAAVALLTLALAVGFGVWGRGVLRWACILIAIAGGTLVAAALDMVHPPAQFDLTGLPWVAPPRLAHGGLDFDLALLPAFVVASLASALKTAGIVTTLQRINDRAWARPEPRSIAGGVAGDGIATMLAGALGAPAINVSATNAATQLATGVTSRVIAFATGALCLLLACFPRAAALLSQVPAPVVAATLVYSGALMLANGIQLAASRLLDARRSLAVGLAVAGAVSMELVPALAAWVPAGLQPLMTATAFGTLAALLLNAVLRIGVRRTVTLRVPHAGIPSAEVDDFVTQAGASWGARRDVIARVSQVAATCLDAIASAEVAAGDLRLAITFDETQIDLRIAYRGRPPILSDRPPTAEELLEDEDGPARMAGYLVRRLVTQLRLREKDGTTELLLTLEH